MREKTVEQALVKAVKAAGGLCIKWTAPGYNGVPDRICLMPDGRILLVELKAPGKKPTALQLRVHQDFLDRGHEVYVIDNPADARALVESK